MRCYFDDYDPKEHRNKVNWPMHMRFAYDIEDDIIRAVRVNRIKEEIESTTMDVQKLLDHEVVKWKGWQTSWGQLRAEGWEITFKRKYNNLRQPTHTAASHDKIYIRHEENNMIGRITIYPANNKDMPEYRLDFMIQEHNQRISNRKIEVQGDTVVNLTEQDIPLVLEAITQIQKRDRRKAKRKVATILEYEQRLKNR